MVAAPNLEKVTDPGKPTDLNLQALRSRNVISPDVYIRSWEEDQFERFVHEWAYYFALALKKEYLEVFRFGGAGDKGRDVVGFIDPPTTSNRKCDVFQCKHYAHQLQPAEFYPELLKICQQTYVGGAYTGLRTYWIISPHGLGPTLRDLIAEPSELKTKFLAWLIDKEPDYKTKKIQLHNSVEAYSYDNIREKMLDELLKEHEACPWHKTVFAKSPGSRPPMAAIAAEIASRENRYLTQFTEAVSDKYKQAFDMAQVRALEPEGKQFDTARRSFYSAEFLRRHYSENFATEAVFEGLKEALYESIEDIVLDNRHENGFVRMTTACSAALSTQIDNELQKSDLGPLDRKGICHHLANEDRVLWVQKNS